ncbi:PH domain-containing protein [Methyloterricola oryzae]|uniref:PH domain-containing protein n=1 Tax=Methyloterricola oryzae TaxID=1495050 RepID=UPI0011AF69F9|nr:PH domain-containing protein [Methyloterricola oryzae]
MKIGDTIYNLDGLPFCRVELARRMCELLCHESGRRYAIEDYPEGGYVIRPLLALAGAQGLGNIPDQGQSKALPAHATHSYRPAVVRANLGMLPVLLVCLMLLGLSGPLSLWGVAFLAIHPERPGQTLEWIVASLRLAGGFGVLSIAALWSIEWLSARYTVAGAGVEARRGLFARETVSLRFEDIRSVTLRQTVAQRLLGIGTLELTSAGTDGVPVQFYDIASPGQVKALIEARMSGKTSDD